MLVMVDTAIAFALKKAGVNTGEAQLYAIALEELRKVDWDAERALGPFVDEVRNGGGLCLELFSQVEVRMAARKYLQARRAERDGEGLKVPAKAGDGAHFLGDSHIATGPVGEKSGGEGVQMGRDCHTLDSSPSPLAEKTGDSSGSGLRRAKSDAGRSAAVPNKPRGLAALQTHARVNSAYICRDGTEIEAIVFSTLPRLAKQRRNESAAAAGEARLFDEIYKYAAPPPNAGMRVGDMIKAEALRKMVQRVGLRDAE